MGDFFEPSNNVVSTTTGGQEPWTRAQPAMGLAIDEAERLYNQNTGFTPFNKSLVIDHSDRTKEGMAGIQNSASLFGSDMSKPINFASNLYDAGGFNNQQWGAMGNMNTLANSNGFNNYSQSGIDAMSNLNSQMMGSGGLTGLQQDAASGYQGLAANGGLNANQRTAMDRFADIGSGSQMQNNPYLDSVIGDMAGDIRDSSNRMAMAAGRYSSGEHQDVTNKNIAEMSARMRMNDYNTQLGRMDAANQNYFGMAQQGVGNQAGAFGSLGNLGQSGLGNMSDTAGTLFSAGDTGWTNTGLANQNLYNAGQGGINNMFNAGSAMPGAYNAMQQPYRDLMGLGSMDEDLATRTINDELRFHNAEQSAPWDRLLALNGIASGAGRVGKTSTESTTQPGASPFQSTVGGALQGYDQWGGLGGAALGGLLGWAF